MPCFGTKLGSQVCVNVVIVIAAAAVVLRAVVLFRGEGGFQATSVFSNRNSSATTTPGAAWGSCELSDFLNIPDDGRYEPGAIKFPTFRYRRRRCRNVPDTDNKVTWR